MSAHVCYNTYRHQAPEATFGADLYLMACYTCPRGLRVYLVTADCPIPGGQCTVCLCCGRVEPLCGVAW